MQKAHSRTHQGWMRRASRIYLDKTVNRGKLDSLTSFLNTYKQAEQYAIVRFWSTHDFSSTLSGKEVTKSIEERFGFTARLSQCVAKQSRECVRSQKERRERMPRIRKSVAALDSRFVTIEQFGGSFDMCLKFGSGVPKMTVPFNWNKHTNRLRSNGWELSRSIRLCHDGKDLFVDLIFEKQKPPTRTEGDVVGIDRGARAMLYTSKGQEVGTELWSVIKAAGKRRNAYHHFIETEENRLLKTLPFTGVRTFVLERLKQVKRGRGAGRSRKRSRQSNRLLSFWHYARVGTRLMQRCEEAGVSINFKDPWKTSQHCPVCGNIDRRNRSGKRFRCLKCGHTDDADHIGAVNLELLGLAGVYSLRSLKSENMA